MEQTILCLNGGSSSLKFVVYRLSGQTEERIFSGAAEAIGAAGGKAWLRAGERVLFDQNISFSNHAEAMASMFAALRQQRVVHLDAAGHRLVHGGPHYKSPQLIDSSLKSALHDLIAFAPLHLPSQLAMVEAVSAHFADLPQVACFDTAFHSGMPTVAQRFALPREMWEQGIRRYGFHGLSYEYIVGKLGNELGQRAIIAHLGNGASMVALKNGASVDTIMGLTPSGGFMMGTRAGDLDPGVILFLLAKGHSAENLEKLLNHQSGLKGVSGESSEMKVLLAQRKTNPDAALAVEMFCYQVRKFVGAYAAVLEGLDTLVFTGGIGERASAVREEICCGLQYLGIEIDRVANASHAAVISNNISKCVVRVVPTDEDLVIARHTMDVVFAKASS